MISYSQRSLFNTLLAFFCLVFLSVVIVFAAANTYFARKKDRIEEGLSAYHASGVSVGGTFYVPPRTLILKDVVIKGKSKDIDLIRLKEVSVYLSLNKFFSQRKLEPIRVYLTNGDIDYSKCSIFLRDNPGYIKDLLAKLPGLDRTHVVIKNCRFILPQGPASTYNILWNNVFFLEDGFLSVRGDLSLESMLVDGRPAAGNILLYPLLYRCLGFFTERGFEMEDMEIRRRNSYIAMSGVAKKDTLRAQGLASLANFFGGGEAALAPFDFIQKIKDFFLSPEKGLPLTGPAAVDLNIVDLKCLARYREPVVEIEEVSFISQGVPYSLTGRIDLLRPFSWDFTFSSYAGPLHERKANPKSLDFIVSGKFEQGAVDGEICVDFLREAKHIQSPDKFKAVFDRARVFPVIDERLEVDIGSLKLSYITPGNEHFLVFDHVSGFCDLVEQQTKIFDFGADVGGGFIKGKAFVDTGHFPSKSFFTVEMFEVEANKLDSLISSFSKVRGELNSKIHYRNYPQVGLFGNISIEDGYLDDFEFFTWLSGLFRLPSLTHLKFDRISTEFLVDDSGASIKDISLKSDDVTIGGFFSIYEEDLVRSKLTLGLSRGLLENSSKFRSLLRLVGDDFSSLDFDFQLSGAVYALNFQWSESQFKRNLRKSIPDFIERGIERKVERAIESIAAR